MGDYGVEDIQGEPKPEVMRMADLGARKAELGQSAQPRNPGKNRTPSKRALLKAIEEAGGKW